MPLQIDEFYNSLQNDDKNNNKDEKSGKLYVIKARI
jgi:hypothetical protein